MQLNVLMMAIIIDISGTTGRLKVACTTITYIKGVYTCDNFYKKPMLIKLLFLLYEDKKKQICPSLKLENYMKPISGFLSEAKKAGELSMSHSG